MKVENWDINKVKPYKNNPRNNDDAVDATANSIKEFGWQQPIVVDKDGVIIVGHTRLKAAKKLGLKQVPIVVAENLSDEKVKAYRLADNKTGELADWDFDLLDDELADINDIDMAQFGFEEDKESDSQDDVPDTNLFDTFVVPPFSYLDTRQGNWRSRKKLWDSLGIKSELGRKENLTYTVDDKYGKLPSTSIFDPVLCEIIYKWFMPKNGNKVLDAFAGGSVRGVVASKLGKDYIGIDLRKEQIEANYNNASEIGGVDAQWYCDDAQNMDKYVKDKSQDLFFICPPYFDLEQYSDNEKDLSNMDYNEFDDVYSKIIQSGIAKLKDNRFAVVVISDVRDKQGFYRDLVGATIKAMESAKAFLYNDMVLLNSIGTAAFRARRSMRNRKVARLHQNVLVFYKGSPKEIQNDFDILTEIDEEISAESLEE